MGELKRTPLFESYKEYGAKTIDFGGWELPVQFSSIKEEHEAVRTKAGLFDVSHMGEIAVKGKDALAFLQKMMTNDLANLQPDQAIYTVMCNETGGTIDDLLVYMLAEEDYLLVVNAANTDKDFKWLKQHQAGEVQIDNVSTDWAQLAIQGPLAESILQQLVKEVDLSEIKFFKFRQNVNINGVHALVSRTGYTGEDGFEIYSRSEDAPKLWKDLLEAGKEEGLVPCGLGARDTLRFEANLVLYGQELSEEISPLEAGLGFAVKTNKADFIGLAVLKAQKENGPARKLIGLEMIDRGIPRHGYPVFSNDEEVGYVTTGTQSPTLKKNIGLALVKAELAVPEQEMFVEIRGKKLAAKTVKPPFYKRSK
ncbi:glycine cleavage system aminomethyltransferase GcvT [Bacillus aerolatus]|uniref:Aminomethyltransferase n=1 Tax=Bacillus aerolatus TaxID=2653354 RepID=A0A6I1FJH0_9BACI|nr:glycine cleavage system aminomethyltransferase GcvT [Bacillus aerolatus]KAB7708785.1 glycine cleavage system aminomethyltransferase GcvT [Bacillus aerolatus]